MIKRLKKIFIDTFFRDDRKVMQEVHEQHMDRVANSFRKHAQELEKARNQVPDIAKKLKPGDLSANTNWQMIQEIGKYLSPHGADNLHVVRVWEKSPSSHTKSLLAEIQCTNSVYSEWLVACSNSMWHTQYVVAKDINDNQFPLGKMTNTVCEIEYKT